jgi:hypothetical protein
MSSQAENRTVYAAALVQGVVLPAVAEVAASPAAAGSGPVAQFGSSGTSPARWHGSHSGPIHGIPPRWAP